MPSYAEILTRINERQSRGDVPLNLGATSLMTHAYAYTGEEKYRAWVLDYLAAWEERTARNGGITPDNIGLSGEIGEYNDGKWWGGYYGWRWPHGSVSLLEPISVAGMNAAALTGEMRHLNLLRSQLDMLWGLCGRASWCRTGTMTRAGATSADSHPMFGVYLWAISMAEAGCRAGGGAAGPHDLFDAVSPAYSSYGKTGRRPHGLQRQHRAVVQVHARRLTPTIRRRCSKAEPHRPSLSRSPTYPQGPRTTPRRWTTIEVDDHPHVAAADPDDHRRG